MKRPWVRLAAAAMLLAMGAARETAAAPVQERPGQVLIMLRMPPAHARAGSGYVGGYGDGLGRAGLRRVAQALARAHGLTLIEDWPMPLLDLDCFVMAVPTGQSPDAAAASLAREPGVAQAQASGLFHTEGAAAPADALLFMGRPGAADADAPSDPSGAIPPIEETLAAVPVEAACIEPHASMRQPAAN